MIFPEEVQLVSIHDEKPGGNKPPLVGMHFIVEGEEHILVLNQFSQEFIDELKTKLDNMAKELTESMKPAVLH